MKFKAIFTRSRIVRGFRDHDTFAAYLEMVQAAGAVITRPRAAIARVRFA